MIEKGTIANQNVDDIKISNDDNNDIECGGALKDKTTLFDVEIKKDESNVSNDNKENNDIVVEELRSSIKDEKQHIHKSVPEVVVAETTIKKDAKWKVTNSAEFEAAFKKIKDDDNALLTFLKVYYFHYIKFSK